jgi:serine/threonine-protein kinase
MKSSQQRTHPDSSDALDAGIAAAYGAAHASVLDVVARLAGGEPVHVELRGAGGESKPSANGASQVVPRGRADYAVFGEIARGGMGVILRGRDANLGRDVAIKVLREDLVRRPEVLQRFVEEAQIGGQLQHPGIVPVYELGLMADERPFFAMKLIEGRTLAALLAERGDSERRKLLDVFEAVCQTVAYAHSRGVVHRDLKPANVLIGAFGEVQVVDWGLAKVLDAPAERAGAEQPAGEAVEPVRTGSSSSSRSLAGAVMGTPAYMAPEQARGEVAHVDERSDVFALGAILCEILTGAPPYDGEAEKTVKQAARAQLGDALRRLDACDADGELVALCKLCMAPEQDDRPRTAAIVAERVHAYLTGVEDRARAAQVRAAEARVRSRAIAGFSAAGVVIVLAAVGAWSWSKEQRARRTREADHAVTAAIQDATLARGREDWTEASAAVGRARARLESGDASEAVRAQVASLGATIGREAEAARSVARIEQENTALLARLRDVRQPESDMIYPTNWKRLDTDYGAALDAYGVQIDTLGIDDAARALGARGISLELASALDEWASVRRRAQDDAGAEHLAKIASALDRDATRAELRAALTARDANALTSIAKSDNVSTFAAPTVCLLGRALVANSKADEAVRILAAARRRYPKDFSLAIECARALRKVKRPEAAVAHYEAALALRPESVEIWHELGQTLAHELNRFADALGLFRAAAERAPSDGHLLFHVANSLTNLQRYEEAIPIYRRSIELDPNYGPAHCDLGISLDELGRTEEAIESYRRAVELEPGAVLNHYNLAVGLTNLKRYEDALASFARAVELDPKIAKIHFMRGYAFEKLERFDDAIESYRRATVLDPKDAQAFYYLGWALEHTGQDAEAVAAYRTALRLKPDQPLWMRHLAWMLATTENDELRDAATAVTQAQRASELEPNEADHSLVLGVALYVAGRYTDAKSPVEHSIELGDEDERRVLFQALCEWHLGNGARAKELYDGIAPSLDDLLHSFPMLRRFVAEARELAAKDSQK